MAEASAPASSANLGPGFDCLALALELRCRVAAERAEEWSVCHEGPDRPGPGETDAVLAAARTVTDVPLRLVVDNRIPLGRGLGSSAAAYAAGAAAALRTVAGEANADRVFRVVSELEGHPDNAAAAVFGGFVLADAEGRAHRLPWNPRLGVVVAVPDARLATAEARQVVAATQPLGVVTRSLARVACLVAGLLAADADLLAAAHGDEIHERPRSRRHPDVASLLDVARAAGALHAAWSGAGPSVLAVVEAAKKAPVVDALTRALGDGGTVLEPSIAVRGLI